MGLDLETLHLKGEIVNHTTTGRCVFFYVYGSQSKPEPYQRSFPAAKGFRVPATGYVAPDSRLPFDVPLGLDEVIRVDVDRYPECLITWEIGYGDAKV